MTWPNGAVVRTSSIRKVPNVRDKLWIIQDVETCLKAIVHQLTKIDIKPHYLKHRFFPSKYSNLKTACIFYLGFLQIWITFSIFINVISQALQGKALIRVSSNYSVHIYQLCSNLSVNSPMTNRTLLFHQLSSQFFLYYLSVNLFFSESVLIRACFDKFEQHFGWLISSNEALYRLIGK